MHITANQFETLYTLALAGLQAHEITIHPHSGAVTVKTGTAATRTAHTLAIIDQQGELTYNATGIHA